MLLLRLFLITAYTKGTFFRYFVAVTAYFEARAQSGDMTSSAEGVETQTYIESEQIEDDGDTFIIIEDDEAAKMMEDDTFDNDNIVAISCDGKLCTQ